MSPVSLPAPPITQCALGCQKVQPVPKESTVTLGEAAAANQTAAEELREEEAADVEATEAMDADADAIESSLGEVDLKVRAEVMWPMKMIGA